VLAGHVHNYERYERKGVAYLVSGGGGATPYKIRRSTGDFYRDPGPHICNFTVERDKLRFQMLKLTLKGTDAKWVERDSFLLTAGEAKRVASEMLNRAILPNPLFTLLVRAGETRQGRAGLRFWRA